MVTVRLNLMLVLIQELPNSLENWPVVLIEGINRCGAVV